MQDMHNAWLRHLDVAVVAHGVEVCLDPAVHAEGRGGAVRHQGVRGVGAGQACRGKTIFTCG